MIIYSAPLPERKILRPDRITMKKHIVSDVKIMGSAANRRARNCGSSLLNAGVLGLGGTGALFQRLRHPPAVKTDDAQGCLQRPFLCRRGHQPHHCDRHRGPGRQRQPDTRNRWIKTLLSSKEQFNQISPENDLKWALIHPRPGADGYNFGPADAYVNFGLSNHMYIVGHTLVWHGQTPDWVFAGTNPPPGVTNARHSSPRHNATDKSRRRSDSAADLAAVLAVVITDRARPVRNCSSGCTTTSSPWSAATRARSRSGTS